MGVGGGGGGEGEIVYTLTRVEMWGYTAMNNRRPVRAGVGDSSRTIDSQTMGTIGSPQGVTMGS